MLLLFALLSLLMGASVTKSLVIDVTEDTYVVADVNDPEDTYGIMNENYGDLEFVKAWYLWNVVQEEVIPEVAEGEEAVPELVEVEYERIVSVIYLKFDLTELEDMEIESAMLQLYAQNVALLAPRYVQAYQVESDWDELTIDFNTAPQWGQNALATTTVYQADQWYGWDVTGGVTSEISSGQFSLAVMLRDMEKASEELVAFPSHESGENISRLLITYTEPGFVFSWYWWVIGGVVVLALLALAFFGGLKLKRPKKS
ncbi:hypothetical protein ES703_73631 [subsurface metagenome]